MSDSESEALVVCAAAFTDNGRVRDHNEDYVTYRVPERASDEATRYGSLFLICDGVGGGVAGEVASEHAGNRILASTTPRPPTSRRPRASRTRSGRRTTRSSRENRDQPEGRRMTTTVVAAVAVGAATVSRALGRQPRLRDQRRADLAGHAGSLLGGRDGSLRRPDAGRGGVASLAQPDHPGAGDVRVQRGRAARPSALVLGDIVLLCSDGLTRHVGEEEILDVVAGRTPTEATRRLVDLANERGGQDNISVIVAELCGPEAVCERAGRNAERRINELLAPSRVALGWSGARASGRNPILHSAHIESWLPF